MQHIRLLFWLKAKLLLRGYRRSASEIVGTLLLLLVFLPVSLGIAYYCGTYILGAPPANGANLLRVLLLGIYLFWLLTPMLGYALNDSYDVTKLFVYPLSMRQIFAGALFGTLLDRPTLLLLPTLLAVTIGYSSSVLTGILTFLALGLFLFHTLALSQALLMAGAGVLQSRKFRDAAAVAIPAISIAYYMLRNMMSQQNGGMLQAFLNSGTWEGLNFLPPGFAARAIVAVQQGHYGETLLYLLILAGLTYGTISLASWLLQKIYAGDTLNSPSSRAVVPVQPVGTQANPSVPSVLSRSAMTPAVSPPSQLSGGDETLRQVENRNAEPIANRKSQIANPPSPIPAFFRFLPPVVQAMLFKEARYILRDPYYKIILVNLIYPVLLPVFISMQAHGASVAVGTGSAWFAAGMMTLSQMQLCCNIFGVEGGAITLLFLFPCSRKQMLIGKNLTLFLALSLLNLLFVTAVGLFTRQISQIGVLVCWTELSLLINLSVGNLVSLYFPMRVVMRGWRARPSATGRGCAFGLLYIVVLLINLTIMLPILAALLLPSYHWFGIASTWLALSIPLAIVYAFGIYLLCLTVADALLKQREMEIMGKVSQEEG